MDNLDYGVVGNCKTAALISKEGSIDFDEMRLKMLRGENMSDPKVRQKLLGREP